MYWHFKKGDENDVVHRGIALHKMIRLLTASTINGGYLNLWVTNSVIRNGLTSRAKETDGLTNTHAVSGTWWTTKNYAITGWATSIQQWFICWKASRISRKATWWKSGHNDGDQILAYRRQRLDLCLQFPSNPVIYRLRFPGTAGSIRRGTEYRQQSLRRIW